MKTIPIGKTLVILVGPSGSGKSTFTQNFDPREIVSSDAIRTELLGDMRRQDHAEEVFAEYHHRINAKLQMGMRVVADATHLRDKDRKKVAEIGIFANATVIYVVINRSVEEKTATGGWRNDVRIKGMTLIEKHEDIFNSNLRRIMDGDGRADMVIDTRDGRDDFEIIHPLTRNPSNVLHDLMSRGYHRVRVLGDVHGDWNGFQRALEAPVDTFFIFLGDVVDYGEKTLDVVSAVLWMVRKGQAITLRGNHERKIANWIIGERGTGFRGRLSHGNDITIEKLKMLTPDQKTQWEDGFLELLSMSPDHIQIGHKWMFTHGAVDPYMWDNTIFRLPKNSKIESMAMFGQTTGEFVDGYPVRKNDWVDELKPWQTAVVGHSIHSVENVTVLTGSDDGIGIMLDTGASKELDGVAGHLSWMDLNIVPDEEDSPILEFQKFGRK